MSKGEIANLAVQSLIWLAMLATFLIYALQLRAIRQASKGQNMLSLINFLQAQDVREARRVVRTTLREKASKSQRWNDSEERAASLVCSTYDVAAILLRSGVVPLKPFIENWGPSIRDCYEVLRPYLKRMQLPDKSGPKYWDDFDWIYQQVKKETTDKSLKRATAKGLRAT